MSNYFLEHYGVVGMKWGRRNARSLGPPVIELGPGEYRDRTNSSSGSSSKTNSNSGTKTKSGSGNSKQSSKRTTYNNETNSSSNSSAAKANKLDVKGTQASLKEGKKIADTGAKMLDDSRKKQNARDLKREAKSMTDADLRQVINRLSMEEKYVQAMEKEGVGKSKTDLQKTLELVGTAVSYADTALEVYDKIQKIRGR